MDERKYAKGYGPSEGTPDQTSVRACPNCGYPVEIGKAFCTSCGQQVWKPAPGVPAAPQAKAASVVVIAAVAIMLAVGGAVAFFLVQPQSEPVATPVSSSMKSGPGKLFLQRNEFAPGDEIKVEFTAPAGYDGTAWVGIIPATVPHGQESVNDQYDLTYQYLKKRTEGELVFTAPPADGTYDLRMHDTDSNGRETASVTFSVKSAAVKNGGGGSEAGLFLGRTEYAPGETIKVRFWAPSDYDRSAWVGVIPSTTPHGLESLNDQYDLSYKYLENQSDGELTFTAPSQPGKYDLRMNTSDNNGKESASVSFTVRSGK